MLSLSPFSLISEKFVSDPEVPEEVKAVDAFMGVMQPIHEAYQRQWMINIMAVAGNQWLSYDRNSRRFVTPPAPSWRIRLTVNKLLPISRIQQAKLAEDDLEFYASANTNDESDIVGAKLGSKFISSIYRDQDFDTEISERIRLWLTVCGNCYVFPFYDQDAGKQIEDRQIVNVLDPATGQPMFGPDGQPITEEKVTSFKTGDIGFDFVDPFELVPDFSTSVWKEQSGVVKKKLRSVDYIFEKYGVKVTPEKFDLHNIQPNRIMSLATSSGVRAETNSTLKHAATVKDYYGAPNGKFPNGRHIITSGGKLLFSGTLPKDIKLRGKMVLPFVQFGAIKVPKRLLDMAPIEPLLPLQFRYNRIRSQIAEDNNLMSRPKVIAPMDSMQEGVWTDQAGEVVFYDPTSGLKPEYMSPPSPSVERIKELERLDQEMDDVGGVHEISRGVLPRRATSGLALNILEEKDTTVIGPMKKSIRRGLERLFSMTLSLASARFTEKRMMKILGERGSQELLQFRGSTDFGSSDDVKVMGDDPFPQSRSAKLEFAMSLVQAGLISAQTARRIVGLSSYSAMDDAISDEETRRIASEQASLNAPRGGQNGQPTPDEEALAQKVAEELSQNQQ